MRGSWRGTCRPRAIAESTFYSDSANDLPLLRGVGRAVAVDPDPRLRDEAARRGWPVLALSRTTRPSP